jgi:hypothetical protein
MNIITPRQLVTLYPWETFVMRTSYACHADSAISLMVMGSAHRSHPTSFHLVDAFDWIPPQSLVPGSRFVGDSKCWTQSVDGKLGSNAYMNIEELTLAASIEGQMLDSLVAIYRNSYIYHRAPFRCFTFCTGLDRWRNTFARHLTIVVGTPSMRLFPDRSLYMGPL